VLFSSPSGGGKTDTTIRESERVERGPKLKGNPLSRAFVVGGRQSQIQDEGKRRGLKFSTEQGAKKVLPQWISERAGGSKKNGSSATLICCRRSGGAGKSYTVIHEEKRERISSKCSMVISNAKEIGGKENPKAKPKRKRLIVGLGRDQGRSGPRKGHARVAHPRRGN